MSSSPPFLPHPSIHPGRPSAFSTYFGAAAIIVPGVLLLIFSNIALLPKLLLLWTEAGLDATKGQWLMDTSVWLISHFNLIMLAIAGAIVLLETRYRRWPQLRHTIIGIVVFAFNTCILSALTAMAVLALLILPKLKINSNAAAPPSAAQAKMSGKGTLH